MSLPALKERVAEDFASEEEHFLIVGTWGSVVLVRSTGLAR
jgi:hypothetical protein